MIYIIILFLLGMAFLFGMAIAFIIVAAKEKPDLREEKRKEHFNERQKMMCISTRAQGICPGVCEKCAWGRRYED